MILFIHGLHSSADCNKCNLLKEYTKNATILTLDLLDIKGSLKSLEKSITADTKIVIGASFGGFYAHYLAKKYDTELLLINPVVNPLNFIEDVEIGSLDQEGLKNDIKRLVDFNDNHKCKQGVEVLFGIDDEIIPSKEASNYFKSYSCKYYKDDHSFMRSFKAYLLENGTLLSKYL